MSDFTKQMISSLLPKGEIWNPVTGGGFDLLLDGIADCTESAIDFLETVGAVRNPAITGMLADLEKEYGIKIPTVSEDIRRARLGARKYVKRRDGTKEQMEYFLSEADFTGMHVYPNSPAVNPLSIGNYLLVNNLRQGDNNYYEVPSESQYWPLFIFIGGAATYGGGGELLSVAKVDVNYRRFDELRKLVMSLKGMHVWVILQINLVPDPGDTGDEPFGFAFDDDARGYSDVNFPDVGGKYQGIT